MKPRRHDFFSEAQFAQFLAVCPPWLAAFAEFGVLTGLRPGEIRRLGRHNVTLRAGMMLEGDEWGLIRFLPGETKSGRDETVPLHPRARDILAAQPASLKHPDLWFIGPKGRPITKGSLRHHFEEARAKAGLPVARPHMLRHTAASWLIQRGVPLAIVQRILRHQSASTTEGYVHVLPVHLLSGMAELMRKSA